MTTMPHAPTASVGKASVKMKGRPMTPHLALQKLANSAMPPTCMLAPEPSCMAEALKRVAKASATRRIHPQGVDVYERPGTVAAVPQPSPLVRLIFGRKSVSEQPCAE